MRHSAASFAKRRARRQQRLVREPGLRQQPRWSIHGLFQQRWRELRYPAVAPMCCYLLGLAESMLSDTSTDQLLAFASLAIHLQPLLAVGAKPDPAAFPYAQGGIPNAVCPCEAVPPTLHQDPNERAPGALFYDTSQS